MQTIICWETKEEYYGRVVEGPRKHINKYGRAVDYWVFETEVGGKLVVWDCLSDYWRLVNTDLRKVKKVLDIEESKRPGTIEKIINILKKGVCNEREKI